MMRKGAVQRMSNRGLLLAVSCCLVITAVWSNLYATVRAAQPGSPTVGALWIDTSDRQVVKDFYYSDFVGAQDVPMGWTGDVASCDPGTTSQAYRDSILTQVNYFRSMAGMPPVTFSDTYNAKAQQAALMMSANGTLSHFPTPDWLCYTADGAEAAGNSNLGLAGGIPFEIAWYVDESLPSVGHRRGILYPQVQQMGTGDIDGAGGGYWSNALWWIDNHVWDPRPATRDDYVAWPPSGYMPHPLVPGLWSLSPIRGDIDSATIDMTMDGQSVNVLNQYIYDCPAICAPEPAIVWEPDVDWGNLNLSTDIVFHITVMVQFSAGAPETFEYDVILFAPETINTAPTVAAGADQTITLPAMATLEGTVSDDGLPTSPGTVMVTWSKVSGPGTVTFANVNSEDTTASFSTGGVYVLRLTASDGELTASDEVVITVNSVTPEENYPLYLPLIQKD